MNENKLIEIVSSRGTIFTFDEEFEEILSKYNWYEDDDGYLVNNDIKAHQLIIGKAPKDMVIDHKDRDKTNCRKENLRFVTHAVNSRNRGMQLNNTTGFKGVSEDKRCGKYNARIQVDGKNKHIGTFSDKESAARAYDKRALKEFGSEAVTNESLGLLSETENHKYDRKFINVIEEVLNTARGVKTEDYGNTWKRLGLLGLYVKIFIKEGRLNELIWKKGGTQVAAKNEGIKDTLIDIAAYAIYGILALDEDNINGETSTREHLLAMRKAIDERLGE